MKLAIISLFTALAATAFAWPQAHIEFIGEGGKSFNQVFIADGNNHAISNHLKVSKIISKSSTACTFTGAQGAKTYTRGFKSADVNPIQAQVSATCLIL